MLIQCNKIDKVYKQLIEFLSVEPMIEVVY